MNISGLLRIVIANSDETGFDFSKVVGMHNNEPPHEKTNNLHMRKTKALISFAVHVTAKLISAFVFATLIIQFLYFLNPKFPVSSQLLCLCSSVCVGPVRKPHCLFSHEAAQLALLFQTNENG